jgi:hypothetical protein
LPSSCDVRESLRADKCGRSTDPDNRDVHAFYLAVAILATFVGATGTIRCA